MASASNYCPLRKGQRSGCPSPCARVDGLEPQTCLAPRADGRPSFWERPSHALPDRGEAPAGEGARILTQRLRLVNRIDVVRNYQRAQNFSHAARVLVGLSRDALAEGYAVTSALPTSLDARSIGWLKFKNPNAPAVKREAEDWGK
jgi:hypothetical protein